VRICSSGCIHLTSLLFLIQILKTKKGTHTCRIFAFGIKPNIESVVPICVLFGSNEDLLTLRLVHRHSLGGNGKRSTKQENSTTSI
jgi:hypothetical protein